MDFEAYVRGILLFFIKPNPTDGLQLVILFVVYSTIFIYIVLFVASILRLLKLTFFETFIASHTKPYAASDRKGDKRILIVGDSTAVGAGARKPEDSIAGRLSRDFPHTDIVNIGINGARTKDAVRAMKVVAGQSFNLVIISVGGNDIWHFTSLKKLQRSLDELIVLAQAVAKGPIILLLYNNIGSSPIFPAIMRIPLKEQGEHVHVLFRSTAARHQIPCVDLFSTEEENPFIHKPEKYFSPDGVHPSSEGYNLWYNRMWRLLVTQGFTF